MSSLLLHGRPYPSHSQWAMALGELSDAVFLWRECDCITALGHVVELATGQNPLVEMLEWDYQDARTAARLAEDLGGIPSVLDRFLPRAREGAARTGQLVLLGGGPSQLFPFGPLGVVLGTEVFGKAEGRGMAVAGLAEGAKLRWWPGGPPQVVGSRGEPIPAAAG